MQVRAEASRSPPVPPVALFKSDEVLAVVRRHRFLLRHFAERGDGDVHPNAIPLALVDDLLEASALADDVEQLPQSLWALRWYDVSGLPCEVLALLDAYDGAIDVPASEARGHLDGLSELLADAVEVVHQPQEVALLRGVGGVVFTEARGRLASRQLIECEILTHSLFYFCEVTDFVKRLCKLLCQLLRLLSAVFNRVRVVLGEVLPNAPALRDHRPDRGKDGQIGKLRDRDPRLEVDDEQQYVDEREHGDEEVVLDELAEDTASEARLDLLLRSNSPHYARDRVDDHGGQYDKQSYSHHRSHLLRLFGGKEFKHSLLGWLWFVG